MSIGFMFLFNSVLLGVGLAMDAFSVSLANGLNEPQMGTRRMCGIAGVFAFHRSHAGRWTVHSFRSVLSAG